MIKVRKRRLLACLVMCAVLAVILAASSNAALFGLIKSRSKAAPVVRHSLVVFPFDRDAEAASAVPEDFGDSVAEYLRTTLSTSKGYAAYLYDDRLTPVKRAFDDNLVKAQDTKGPFYADKAKVTKLADILSTDYYVVGSVESYTFDKEKKAANLTLKADLYVRKTGKIVQSFVVGGAAESGAQALDEDELMSIAAGKAVEALREKVLSTSAADNVPVPAPKVKAKK